MKNKKHGGGSWIIGAAKVVPTTTIANAGTNSTAPCKITYMPFV